MRNVIKISVLIIFACLFSAISYAENNIAYIDVDKILSKSKSGKFLFNQLNEFEKIELDALKLEEKKFKEEEKKILSSQNIISNE